MAGDEDRDRIGGAGFGDLAGLARRAEPCGDVAISRRLPRRYVTKSVPDPLLVVRSAEIELNIGLTVRMVDNARQLRDRVRQSRNVLFNDRTIEALVKLLDERSA